MKRYLSKAATFLTLLMGWACVEPYTPPEISGDVDILVVDGFVDATAAEVNVRLSRAVQLTDPNGSAPVSDDPSKPILVSLEDDQGSSLVLNKVDAGNYHLADLPLDIARTYRLRVVVSPSEEYVSDFVEVKETPAMAISWQAAPDNLKILIDTEDPTGKSKYFRWTFSETWEYTSPLFSGLRLQDGIVYRRTPEDEIYRCYATANSSNINIASTSESSQNVIRRFHLHSVAPSSQKLQHKYSINVKQFALTEDAYNYWLNLYKTTENVGGLFDPLPGEVTGNFRSLRGDEHKVVGYFSASTLQEQRIFITPDDDLPPDYASYYPPTCPRDTLRLELLPLKGDKPLLLNEIYSLGTNGPPSLIGYYTAPSTCIDCRLISNGVTNKPPFWP